MKRCSDYFLDEKGEFLVDYLGLTERLNRDLAEILRSCSFCGAEEISVPHVNKSTHQEANKYLTPELDQYVQKKYADDMKLFKLVEHGIYSKEAATFALAGAEELS
jgi:MoaA/NifB/PqqE/SkfB family radical SAM enzyme